MNKSIIVISVGAVLLLGGYFLIGQTNKSPESLNANQQENSAKTDNLETSNQNISSDNSNQNVADVKQAPGSKKESAPLTIEVVAINQKHEVIYSDSGYSPSTLSIKSGDTVEFKNQSASSMWTASAMHPVHTVYGGTSLQTHCPDAANVSFDECASAQPDQSWSFTFNKKGTWGYHNHVNPSHFGKIIVE